MVHLNDGASLAHLGHPDMRVPISYALHHPERADVDVPEPRPRRGRRADLRGARTPRRFPCLRLAREAGEAGGTAPCVLNAANEVAVAAFLDGRIPFTGIPEVVEAHARRDPRRRPGHFDDLYAADAAGARARAGRLVERLPGDVSWFLAFAGFAFLIVAHEFGHFVAAKRIGMRVEKFFLFFPPALVEASSAARPSTGSARSRSAAS